MLRLIGVLSVFFPCLIAGVIKSYRLKKRYKSLEALKLAIERVGVEISFTKKRLENVFCEASRDFSLPMFFDTVILAKMVGLKKAWHETLCKYADEMALLDTDIKALETIGDLAGVSGEEQQRTIRTLLKLLELSIQEAREAYTTTGKLCRSSGLLVGLLAVILLI